MATDEKTGEEIFGRYQAGLQHVGSYQVSGVPFVTGSDNLDAGKEFKIEFDGVTKSILVRNPGAVDVRVHFASTGSGNVYAAGHFLRVSGSADAQKTVNELRLDCKCSELYISNNTSTDNATYEVFAELTGIHSSRMFTLTGSGITE
jgi:hypothetical protein